jgi:catechol 2,3-dioxygenase-like lactoylglutathione lyase family enzyme
MAEVRYFVDDVDQAIRFYVDHLGFRLNQQFGPAIAIVARGDLQLWLAGPAASASRPMPDGRKPSPGGWNRFVLRVEDIEGEVQRLKARGLRFRNYMSMDLGAGKSCARTRLVTS